MANDSKFKNSYGNNHARNREETQFDTLDLAQELKHKVSKYVMNEKRVPTRWRYMNGKPAIDYARHIRDLVSMANEIQLNQENIEKRNELQKQAVAYCNILQLQLMDIIAECEGATHENMREITDTLDKLIGKIVNWNKSDDKRAR